MKLAYLAFDAMVSVPGGRLVGTDLVNDITESTFRAVDGWELVRVEKGVFTVRAQHMLLALTVESSECQYIAAAVEPVDTEAPVVAGDWKAQAAAKGKKR